MSNFFYQGGYEVVTLHREQYEEIKQKADLLDRLDANDCIDLNKLNSIEDSNV